MCGTRCSHTESSYPRTGSGLDALTALESYHGKAIAMIPLIMYPLKCLDRSFPKKWLEAKDVAHAIPGCRTIDRKGLGPGYLRIAEPGRTRNSYVWMKPNGRSIQ